MFEKLDMQIALVCLTVRQKQVIELRYGLSQPTMNLRQIGDELGISATMVRYHEVNGLKRIKDFLEEKKITCERLGKKLNELDDFELKEDMEMIHDCGEDKYL